jgi:peptide/nickel transport system permease protein
MAEVEAGHDVRSDPSATPAVAQRTNGTASAARVSQGPTKRSLRSQLRTHRGALIGIAIVIFMVLFCFIGPLIYPTDQITTNINQINQPPSAANPLGTDGNGFNILGRLMVGGQSALEVGLAAAVLATVIGVVWGTVAGLVGGIVDSVMMRIVDGLLAIPALFLLLFLASVMKPDTWTLILVIAVVAWLIPARLLRGETLTLRVREYVEAVRLMGGSNRRVVFFHIIPNAAGTIIVNTNFQVADSILLLAGLSFLGLGLPLPAVNWGSMLTDGLNFLYAGYWWQVYPAGLCIVITVLAFNMIGENLRHSLDARIGT